MKGTLRVESNLIVLGNTILQCALPHEDCPSPPINEVERGTGEISRDQFVELYNPYSRPIELSSYSLWVGQYGSVWQSVPLKGVVPARGHFLVGGLPPCSSGEECVRNNRWPPWNPTNTVVLKEKRNPIPMYAKRVDPVIPVRDAPVGFDLEVGDWVAPHGSGKNADICFTCHSDIKDFWTGKRELLIACTNHMDGFYRAQKDLWSEFHSAYEAPIASVKLQQLPQSNRR